MWFFIFLLAFYCLKLPGYFIYWINNKGRDKRPIKAQDTARYQPTVDILLPMYNEEKVVLATIQNLLNITYEKSSIIVIDDGSTDRSVELVKAHFGDHPRMQLLQQPGNAGKSAALNRGMNASDSDIIVCVDADTLVRPDVVDRICPYFQDETVTAVSGYVRVGNKINFLTSMQNMEYLTIQNYDRILFDPLNGILVVPGALGAFRREVVKEVGGFTSDALAEDCDITLRMLCRNYRIKNAPDACSYTEAPVSAKMFFKQRVRWTVGLVQGLWKHGKNLIGQPNRALSLIVLPYTWLYRVILPFFIPLADYYFLYEYFIQGRHDLLKYYLLCIGVEALTSFVLLVQSEERTNPVKLIFLQRFLRHLTFITYLSIFVRYFNGNLYGWGKIPRQGNVKLDQ